MIVAELAGVSEKRGSRYLVKNINWQVSSRERWIVLGANGCGKTTLMSIMAGYRAWTEGEISLFGRKLTEDSAEDLRQNIGFVSESFFDQCLRRENGINIVLGGYCGQLCEDDSVQDRQIARAVKLLKAFGMEHKGMYPYDLMSRGQRQKILLCRAFMRQPKLLLLDEPMTGLDVIARDTVMNTLKEIASQTDAAIVCVTHHADEIQSFYTHALLMKNGKVHSMGLIREVITEENMSDFFDNKTTVSWEGGQVRFMIDSHMAVPRSVWNEEEGDRP
jgi:iron complex transport system ATP-binding protein